MTRGKIRATIIKNTGENRERGMYIKFLKITKNSNSGIFTLSLEGEGAPTSWGFGHLFFRYSISILCSTNRYNIPENIFQSITEEEFPNITLTTIQFTEEQINQVFALLEWRTFTIPRANKCINCETICSRTEGKNEVGILKYVCNSCIPNYKWCSGCNLLVHEDDIITTEDNINYCTPCGILGYFFFCANCEENIGGGDYSRVGGNDDRICSSCYEMDYSMCGVCGEDSNTNDMQHCSDLYEDYCEDCWDEHDCDTNNHISVNLGASSADNKHISAKNNKVYKKPKATKYENGRPTGYERTPTSLTFYKGKKSELINSDLYIGVEIECEVGKYKREMRKEMPSGCIIKGDPSVSGLELTTPPAQGQKFEDIINKSCEILRKNGYYGTAKAGLHVHIDARKFMKNPTKIANIAKTYFAVEDILFSMLPHSRWNSHFCQAIGKNYLFAWRNNMKSIEDEWYLKKGQMRMSKINGGYGMSDKYYGLGINSIRRHKTIELRYHSGTTNPHKILMWVAINLRLFEYALNNYDNDKIKNLFDMTTSQNKFENFCKVFNMPRELKKYMEERISIFNPLWEIELNKGRGVRSFEENNIIQYKKIFALESKRLLPEEIRKMKNIYKENFGKGWTKKFKSEGGESSAIDHTERMIKAYMKKPETCGIMSREEKAEKIKLLQRGMLLSVNGEIGNKEDDEFKYEAGGLLR